MIIIPVILWELIQTLSGESEYDRLGGSETRISGDGETIIAAETFYDSTDDEGRLKVWKYNSSASPKWSLTGIPSEFLGENADDGFANGVSVNYDGSRIAAGALRSYGGRSNNGYIKVFDYTPSATDSWTLIQTGTTTWTHSSGIFYGELAVAGMTELALIIHFYFLVMAQKLLPGLMVITHIPGGFKSLIFHPDSI